MGHPVGGVVDLSCNDCLLEVVMASATTTGEEEGQNPSMINHRPGCCSKTVDWLFLLHMLESPLVCTALSLAWISETALSQCSGTDSIACT